MLEISEHVFVAKQQEFLASHSSSGPAAKMVVPVGKIRHEFAFNEASDELIDRIAVGNFVALNAVVVHRNGYVARVAEDVNDARVARIEVFMALQNSRPACLEQDSIRPKSNRGNARLDIGK